MKNNLPPIAQCAKEFLILPSKKLGQNFIFDKNICEKIVRSANIQNISDANIIEIGPGPAGLTRAICDLNPKTITLIEKDARCIALLNIIKDHYNAVNISIINEDALLIDFSKIIKQKKSVHIIANLPYNIGTTLLTQWLERAYLFDSITVMLQKEVVDRIIASANTKIYGRLSIISQNICNISKHFDLDPSAFYPRPKVKSTLVTLKPKKEIYSLDLIRTLSNITRYAFSKRRKMIKTSLNIIPENILREFFDNLLIRPENIPPSSYLNLAKRILDIQIDISNKLD